MPHALRREYYCEGCHSSDPPRLVTTREFCETHYITRAKLNTLLRRRVLVAKKFKGRNYVALNPQWLALNIAFEDVI